MPIAASRVHAFLPKPLDAGIAAIVLWLGAVTPGFSDLPYSGVIYPLLLVACGTALAWRQQHPVFSVSVIGGAMVIHAVVFNSMSLLALSSILLAVWTIQSCLNKPLRWVFLGFFTAGSGLAAGLASVAASPRRDPLEHVILVSAVLLAVAVVALAGTNRRATHSRTERALERVALLEAQQDALHRLATAEERARLARELHDVLGHTLAIIAVQAEGALLMLERSPERSREALRNMAAISRRGVDETRALVDVLQDDEGVPTVPVPEPERTPRGTAPGLFPEIVMLAENAGLPVRVTLDLSRQTLPPSREALVLDTVKEALANVAGHAGFVPVRLSCIMTGAGIVLDVENGSGSRKTIPGDVSHTGTGLSRLRKRATALGATLDAGPGDDGWKVSLTVPREPRKP